METPANEEVMSNELYDVALSDTWKWYNIFELDSYRHKKTRPSWSSRDVFDRCDEYLLRRTHVKNNILHLAIIGHSISFVKEAVNRFPFLLCWENSDKNNPLHAAAEFCGADFVRKLRRELGDLKEAKEALNMKNSKGNTPLHVALVYDNFEVAKLLFEWDPSVIRIVNDSDEAPLHLAVKHHAAADYDDPSMYYTIARGVLWIDRRPRFLADREDHPPPQEELITLLLDNESCIACWRDKSGLTPLHRAASLSSEYNLRVIELILYHCPLSLEVCDSSGKNILHHLINKISSYKQGHTFLNKLGRRMFSLLNHQDQEGNTPLHLAVMSKDFIMMLILMDYDSKPSIKNVKGLSAANLIQQKNILEMEKRMMSKEDGYAAENADSFYLERRLEKAGVYLLSSQDSNGRNFLHKLFQIKTGHVIVYDSYYYCVRDIIERFPELLNQTDNHGDTPMHILARLAPYDILINYRAPGWNNPLVNNPNLYPIKPHYEPNYSKPYVDYTFQLVSLRESNLLGKLLELYINQSNYNLEKAHNSPWLMQNTNGNTPLHEAIIAKNDQAFVQLVSLAAVKELTLTNNRKETLCHLLASLTPCETSDSNSENVMKNIHDTIYGHCQNTIYSMYESLDEGGLSPLMRALKVGNFDFALRLCAAYPEAVGIKDSKNRTILHQLVSLPKKEETFVFIHTKLLKKQDNIGDTALHPTTKDHCCFDLAKLWRKKDNNKGDTTLHLTTENDDRFGLAELLRDQDSEGDTVLHLAIEEHHFDLAKLLLDMPEAVSSNKTSILKVENKKGITPGDMIGALPHLTKEFEYFIWHKDAMIGTRSIWGIPSIHMTDYVNTMGVIAALLTTITFTAAFTVPGGLNQEKGFPLLIRSPSFLVFIISDVIAMCLSMMVLICLLWIMATAGNKSKSIMLLDFAIVVLLGSFYTTLLTFMTGLYATTYHVNRWVAIVSLIPCSILLLLIHKTLAEKLVIPCSKAMIIFAKKVFAFVSKVVQGAKC